MKCYICDAPSTGICAKCKRFYCSTHGGQPLVARQEHATTIGNGSRIISREGELFCKVCQIGPPHYCFGWPQSNPAADQLLEEVVDACYPSPFSNPLLSKERAARLLDALLGELGNSDDEDTRIQIASSLRLLVGQSSFQYAARPIHPLVTKSTSALLAALDDQSERVRFAAAESLLYARCYESIEPIVTMWVERENEAFNFNIMRILDWWTHGDSKAWRELKKVMAQLRIEVDDLPKWRRD